MSRWFRVDDALVDDPKVQRLSGDLVKALLNLWCLTSQNDGILPSMEDMAFKLRMKKTQVAAIIAELVSAGLIDRKGEYYVPHNWDVRQYRSDANDPTGAKRAKEYRDRKRSERDASRDAIIVTTVPDERQNRTDANQNRTDPRDALQKRVGDFRQAIVKAFEAANSPTAIETSRAELWLTQGYQEDICLAVISEIVRKKPSVTTLAYFENAIRDAHASKAPPRQTFEIANPTAIDWEAICASYKKFGHWSKQGGNSPDSGSCRCPPEILAKHGIAVPLPDNPAFVPNLKAM
jgi:hypothetical protein